MNIKESIKRSIPHLLKWQCKDGHFEGELSSNTFPTCAYALIQLELGLPIDDKLIEWFIRSQKDSGLWGLDASDGVDNQATLFAKLALMEINDKIPLNPPLIKGDERDCLAKGDKQDYLIKVETPPSEINQKIEIALKKIPNLTLNQWLIKLFYARCGRISWKELNAPKILSAMMRLGEGLLPILPKSFVSKFKPPEQYAPPVRLFYTQTFQNLFIAEKHTVVPVFIIMEIHGKNRSKVVKELLKWLIDGRCSDGSWFRVGL